LSGIIHRRKAHMRTTIIAVAAAGFMALAPQPSFAQDAIGGALLGAGAGAAIGGAAGGGRGAAIGAATGAAVGATVGANAAAHRHGHYYGSRAEYVGPGPRSVRRCWINRYGERVCKIRRYY
jgi:hypothetical protein